SIRNIQNALERFCSQGSCLLLLIRFYICSTMIAFVKFLDRWSCDFLVVGWRKRFGLSCAVILSRMNAKHVTPILNVSDMAASFAWFERWGWRKLWDWRTPPTFGAVGCGEVEIFLCHGTQGGRGKGTNMTTFQKDEDE